MTPSLFADTASSIRVDTLITSRAVQRVVPGNLNYYSPPDIVTFSACRLEKTSLLVTSARATSMGCSGSKEAEDPELNSNKDGTSLDQINVRETGKGGGNSEKAPLTRKKSTQVGCTSHGTPSRTATHAQGPTSP